MLKSILLALSFTACVFVLGTWSLWLSSAGSNWGVVVLGLLIIGAPMIANAIADRL